MYNGMIFVATLEVPVRSNFKTSVMKKIVFLPLLFLLTYSLSAQNERKVFGTVTDGTNPIENVAIKILDTDKMAATDKEGKYSIAVGTGDQLQFSFTGLRTISIKIEDVTRVLNPIMVPDVTELDEVVVAASKRRSQKDLEEDYAINPNIIRTAWGLIDADRAAGNVRMLEDDEIYSASLCILDLLRNRFPGIRVVGSCTTGGSTGLIGDVSGVPLVGGFVFIRGSSSITNPTPAIFDIDGQIFSDAPVWLDVTSIKRLAILGNLGTTVTYGNTGKGGVIVINTVNGNPQLNKIVDRARLKNNFLKEPVLTKFEMAKDKPIYLQDLEATTNFEEAKNIYMTNKDRYSNSPFFFIDSYNYFYDAHNEKEFSDAIIKGNFGLFEGNAVLIKALAYSYEGQDRFDKAHELYKEIFMLRPNYAQSYLDMANSYRNVNSYKSSASMYSRFDYLVEQGFMKADSVDFDKIIQREHNNLLALRKNDIVTSTESSTVYVAEEDFEGTRLVFEWNDSEAEFDLQFVNPGNQYFIWKHSLADNPETIYREKDYGHNTTEYLIDGALSGTWKVNIKYLGNKSLTPTYLKATIYHNYGTKGQRKEVKVFKLNLKNVNHELFQLQSSSNLVSR